MRSRGLAGVRALLAVCATVAALAPAAGQALTLEGRWRLVEQHYGEGRANQAEPGAELELEFVASEPEWTGRIRIGTSAAPDRPWPAFVNDGRFVEVEDRRLSWSDRRDAVRADYRVRPSPTDDLVLHVVEDYALDGRSGDLVGTVSVTFEREGKRAGSYRLHRRWVRRP